uniref:Uncharacterized protein n=1 Tax=Avena sativa TaxID=4498 RepID=A0ACD5YB20_AVESA
MPSRLVPSSSRSPTVVHCASSTPPTAQAQALAVTTSPKSLQPHAPVEILSALISPAPATPSAAASRGMTVLVDVDAAAATASQLVSNELKTPVHVPASASPDVSADAATPLFVPVNVPLLQAPGSTTPLPPKRRKKTLAGVSGFAGFPVQRSSPRLRAKERNLPMAKLAEKVLCQRLGIVGEGDQITEAKLLSPSSSTCLMAAFLTLLSLPCKLSFA